MKCNVYRAHMRGLMGMRDASRDASEGPSWMPDSIEKKTDGNIRNFDSLKPFSTRLCKGSCETDDGNKAIAIRVKKVHVTRNQHIILGMANHASISSPANLLGRVTNSAGLCNSGDLRYMAPSEQGGLHKPFEMKYQSGDVVRMEYNKDERSLKWYKDELLLAVVPNMNDSAKWKFAASGVGVDLEVLKQLPPSTEAQQRVLELRKAYQDKLRLVETLDARVAQLRETAPQELANLAASEEPAISFALNAALLGNAEGSWVDATRALRQTSFESRHDALINDKRDELVADLVEQERAAQLKQVAHARCQVLFAHCRPRQHLLPVSGSWRRRVAG